MEQEDLNSYGEENKQTSFVAEFFDGYSFKNLIDFLRRINTTAIFEFHPNRIECFHYDTEARNILTHIVIKGKELYQYQLKLGNEEEKLRMGINLRDLQRFIKGIGKKDSLILYKKAGDHFIYIQISNAINKNSQGNFSMFRPCKAESVLIDIPRYRTNQNCPHVILSSANLAQICSSMNVLKSSLVRIRVSGGKLTIDNLTDDRSSGRVDTFPVRTYLEEEKVEFQALVKASTLKCLTKLSNLSPNGLLKMYTESEKPLLVICKNNGWGKMRIYLSSVEN